MVDPAIAHVHERLSSNPDDAEALVVAWQFHGGRGDFQTLATLVEQTAGRRRDAVSAADLYFRAGELWAKNLGRADRAIHCYRRAIELDPGQSDALAAARTIAVQTRNARLMAQLVERELGTASDPSRRLTLLRELADVRAELNDPSGQAAALEEIVRLVPDDLETLRALAAAYLARAETPDGGDADRRRAAHLLATLAQVLGGAHAMPFATAALDAWPGDENAFAIVHDWARTNGAMVEIAGRLIAMVAANPESSAALVARRDLAELYLAAGQHDDALAAVTPLASIDPDAVPLLARVYRQSGRLEEYTALMRARTDVAPEARLADLRDLVAAYSSRGDMQRALGLAREVLALDPGDATAFGVLEDRLRTAGQWWDLAALLRGAAVAPSTPGARRVELLRELARVTERKLEDTAGATEAWETLRGLAPGDAEAERALEKLYARTENWDGLCALLEQRARAVPDRATWLLLAKTQRERRGDRNAEADALLAAQTIARVDETSAQLVEALRAAGRNDALTGVLRERADAAPPGAALARWTALATHLEAMRATRAAVEAWRSLLATDPDHGPAWDALERLLHERGDDDGLLVALAARAERPAPDVIRARIHARAALVAARIGDDETAMTHARRGDALAPDDDTVAAALEPLIAASGESEVLRQHLRDRIARATDAVQKLALHRRLARVTRDDETERMKAWDDVRVAARHAGLADDAEALTELADAAEARGEFAAMADLLAQAGDNASDALARRTLHARRARGLDTKLGRTADALVALRRAAEAADPPDAALWAELAELGTRAGAHDVVADALEHQLASTDDEDARVAIAERLADVCESELHDRARALAALEQQYDADPTDHAIVERMVRLAEEDADWSTVARHLGVLVDVADDGEEKRAVSLRLAHVQSTHLGDPEAAFATLRPLARGADGEILELLRSHAQTAGLAYAFAEVLTVAAEHAPDGITSAARWLELSAAREAAGNVDGAVYGAARAVLALPGDEAAIDRLFDLAPRVTDLREAGRALRAAIDASGENDTTSAIGLRAADVLGRAAHGAIAFDLVLAAQARRATDERLLSALEGLAATTGRWDELFLAFDRRRNATRDDAERFDLLMRATRIAMADEMHRDTGIGYIQQAANLAIVSGASVTERLQSIADLARESDTVDPDRGVRTAVIELFAQRAEEVAEDLPRAGAALAQIAGTLCADDLALPEHAFALWGRALELDPSDDTVADRYERVALELERGGEIVSLYDRVQLRSSDEAVLWQYEQRSAKLLDERLGRTDEAMDVLRRAAQRESHTVPALRALASLLRREDRSVELIAVLDDLATSLPAEAPSALREMAAVWYDKLGSRADAVSAWNRLLAIVPDDAGATAAIAGLARDTTVAPESLVESPADGVDGRATDVASPPSEHVEPAASSEEGSHDVSIEVDPLAALEEVSAAGAGDEEEIPVETGDVDEALPAVHVAGSVDEAFAAFVDESVEIDPDADFFEPAPGALANAAAVGDGAMHSGEAVSATAADAGSDGADHDAGTRTAAGAANGTNGEHGRDGEASLDDLARLVSPAKAASEDRVTPPPLPARDSGAAHPTDET